MILEYLGSHPECFIQGLRGSLDLMLARTQLGP